MSAEFGQIARGLWRRRAFRWLLCLSAIMAAGYVLIPKPPLLEAYNFSTAVYDREGRLLKLSLSMDDKYRLFVPGSEISPDTEQALLLYEDRWFYYHPGVNPVRIAAAIYEMLSGGRKQGASTVTMQLARIRYNLDTSTPGGKLLQMLRALQLEMFYSKDEILEAYFNLAPYGGNIEGIGAAAQIYFNRKVSELNLGQILALTVIPQNPSARNLLSPEGIKRNQKAATRLKKRWLEHYPRRENQYLNLPLAAGKYLPDEAPHAVRRILRQTPPGTVVSTLDLNYQRLLEEILTAYVREQKGKGVNNAAAMIVDASTMEVLASVGSAGFYQKEIFGQVDGTSALRSPGSALKPFIYALALDKGIIHPMSMLKDVPRNYGLYTPENFDRSFYGLVNATQALVYSRNIPAVDLLRRVGETEFHAMLHRAGVHKLRPAGFYGLALALGGVEVSMQDMAALYAMLYNQGNFQPLRYVKEAPAKAPQRFISPEAAFLTLHMLSKNRPVDESYTPFAMSLPPYPVSWKTGTSYGFKDAWSVGVAGKYVVAVWIGNFDGTPNNAFVGRDMAAPLFFRIVRRLGKLSAIPKELNPGAGLNLAKVKICRSTGDIADDWCPKTVVSYFIPGVSEIKVSGVSRPIPIDVKTGLRACRHTPPSTVLKSYDFWPSDVLQAYASAGISLRLPPPFMENCPEVENFRRGKAPEILLPAEGSVFAVRSAALEKERMVLKASADADAGEICWFVENRLDGCVPSERILEIKPRIGKQTIRAVDNMGRSSEVSVEVRLVD